MALFDKLKNIEPAGRNISASEEGKTFVFEKMPSSYDEFINLKEASLSSPFDKAALTVIALCFYPENM